MTGHVAARRRRPVARATVAAVGAVLALGLTGCTQVGIEENTFETGPLPSVSDGGAATVLAGIDATWNDANASRDPELLATALADPLLGTETAVYALDATADPDDAVPAAVLEHTDPTVFVPRFESYPQWFVAASTVVDGAPMRFEIATRDGAAAPWSMPFSTDLLAGTQFPELALDDAGYVVPVPLDEQSDRPVTPAELAAAHAAALSGGEAGGGASFAADTWSTARVAADAQRGAAVGEAAQVSVAYQVGDVLPQVLETSDGGMVVCYSLTQDVVYQVQPTFFLTLDPPTAALVGTDQVVTSLTEQWSLLLATYVPADGGAARVIGARVDRTGLTGS